MVFQTGDHHPTGPSHMEIPRPWFPAGVAVAQSHAAISFPADGATAPTSCAYTRYHMSGKQTRKCLNNIITYTCSDRIHIQSRRCAWIGAQQHRTNGSNSATVSDKQMTGNPARSPHNNRYCFSHLPGKLDSPVTAGQTARSAMCQTSATNPSATASFGQPAPVTHRAMLRYQIDTCSLQEHRGARIAGCPGLRAIKCQKASRPMVDGQWQHS